MIFIRVNTIEKAEKGFPRVQKKIQILTRSVRKIVVKYHGMKFDNGM